MIRAILKLQGCTTKRRRRAFVGRGYNHHGIAAGVVSFYEVTAPSWAAIRKAVAGYDSTGARMMGFSEIGPKTVESFTILEEAGTTAAVRFLEARMR